MKGYPSEEGRGGGWEEKTVNERKGMSGVCCNVRGWEADMGQVLLSDLAIDRGSCNKVCSVRMRLPKCANPASRVARRHSNAIVEARHTIQSSVSAHWMSMRWSVSHGTSWTAEREDAKSTARSMFGGQKSQRKYQLMHELLSEKTVL